MSMEDIKNLIVVSPHLATAGQPSVEQLGAVATEGYQLVINLGLMDKRYCLDDEAGVVAALGMDYHHIPVEFAGPQLSDLRAFFAIMDANAGRRILVHCAANYRVTCFVALYGRTRWGWTETQAAELIGRVWQPDQVWQDFMRHALGAPALRDAA